MGKEETAPSPLIAPPVCCGFPSPAEQYVESSLALSKLLAHKPAATFFVRAAGDSMLQAEIRQGDIRVVDRSIEAADGMIVIAAGDNEFTVKYRRRDRRGIRLEPANPEYRAIHFAEGMELWLFRVVTACIHQFNQACPMIGLVDGNNFFVLCERVFDPALTGKPVAVLSNNDGCRVSPAGRVQSARHSNGNAVFPINESHQKIRPDPHIQQLRTLQGYVPADDCHAERIYAGSRAVFH